MIRGRAVLSRTAPLGVAGGINLYQFNGNNPATFTDPFGLKPDTVKVVLLTGAGKTAASCKKVPECKRQFQNLDNTSEYWEFRQGPLPARCKAADFEVGCTDPVPVPGHGPGGTIAFDPADLPKARRNEKTGLPQTPVSVLTHELGHANGCKSEACAQVFETKALEQEKQMAEAK